MASSHHLRIDPRHIQNLSDAKTLEPHWGYASRAVPCTNDPGSCAYLDAVYGAHDRGMLYTGIMWSVIGAILLLWALFRHVGRPTVLTQLPPSAPSPARQSSVYLARRSLGALRRQYLLPDAARILFGRITRLQVLILASLAAYLIVFSFVGIGYNTWVTPVKDMPGVYNTRVTLGPWSDRIGVLAYALTPLSVMLGTRESVLSLVTGVPYQSFNFLHRWLGYIIVMQSSLHTIGWCVIEGRLYQPQPKVGIEWIKQGYMIWGVVAMILLLLLFVLSTPWGIRLTGYEFFRKAHYVLAMVYIGACWGHWAQLKCFLIPSLILWFLDRGARLVRTALLHYRPDSTSLLGFRPSEASVTRFPDREHGDVVRLDLDNSQDPWAVGQHYYMTFAQGSIWQSHPFTPLNAPVAEKSTVKHSYIFRAKRGETKKIADLVASGASNSTPVILTGPYGERMTESMTSDTNVVCVAGGTGITFVLPVLLELARQPLLTDRKTELIWAIRHASDVDWIRPELAILHNLKKALNLRIRIFATRDNGTDTPVEFSDTDEKAVQPSPPPPPAPCPCGPDDDNNNDDAASDMLVSKMGGGSDAKLRHPDLARLVGGFLDDTVMGPTKVFASGPGGMISDLRDIVARRSSAARVWRRDEKFDVSLVCDDRLEF